MNLIPHKFGRFFVLTLIAVFFMVEMHAQPDTVVADVVAFDQPFLYNRLGAAQPTGMIFALRSDVEPINGKSLAPGNVTLKAYKRPRPIVLRMNKGNIIKIKFTNYLRPYVASEVVQPYPPVKSEVTQNDATSVYPVTRMAGFHVMGMQMVGSINSDGSWAGANENSMAAPGETKTYVLLGEEEGTYIAYSPADDVGFAAIDGGQISSGLFGSITVQPVGAEWYRSQVTEEDLYLATTKYALVTDNTLHPVKTVSKEKYKDPDSRLNVPGLPLIDYNAIYGSGPRKGVPILKMYTEKKTGGVSVRTLVHADLTAIITGPDAGRFPPDENDPVFFNVPGDPDRRQPYREFAIHYHEAPFAVQAFPVYYEGSIAQTLQAGGMDLFAINYGTGGIGAEIYANRIGTGPMRNCIDCNYEEFFLSSWPCGDPAAIVDIPANATKATMTGAKTSLQNMFDWATLDKGDITSSYPPIKASKVIYPDDPSNVYHSYMNDHVKFRVNHCGAGVAHVHHQHAHQWLHSPNSDDGHYLDSQTISPGTSYTMEIVKLGSGNLNKTVGDQIFHCHFYPHFAQGMWALWRVHDVFEAGTVLNDDLIPLPGSRALPDGEIAAGQAKPAIVPMPTLPMAPTPSKISIENGQVVVEDTTKNPGFPYYIPGIAGSRAPHPPLDFAVDTVDGKPVTLDGGLPRNVVYNGNVVFHNETQYDWTKIYNVLQVVQLPEGGTPVERVAMRAHATRTHQTVTPSGLDGGFILNGRPPVQGAPFADPAVDEFGFPAGKLRRYKAANIQMDVILNKKGWHYPQQRMIALWGDVASTISGYRPPQPFFFRANSGEFIEYWHTNLVPDYYDLDDFQVRTPTDILGQHIHLVKFDVTSSDGAANGWNYEDGTFSPDEVRVRIQAINNQGDSIKGKRVIYNYQAGKTIKQIGESGTNTKDTLKAQPPNPVWGKAPATQDWTGAQTTIQRWYSDPLLNNLGEDRTLRTVFTHDHFSPSTHQQIGLYAGLLIEPANSTWINPVTGEQLGTATLGKDRKVPVSFKNSKPTGTTLKVDDGGPTDWQANIVTANTEDSYREFMMEFQDNQLAYFADSKGESEEYPTLPLNPTTVQLDTFTNKANRYRGWMDPTYAINAPGIPQIVSTGGQGTYSYNYRSEPLPLRLVNTSGQQPSGTPGNPAYVFSSTVTRADPLMNAQPVGGTRISSNNDFTFPVLPISADMQPGDPYTPLFRAYENDRIQMRTLVGSHVAPHFFNANGVKWFFEPSWENSGYRSTQIMSISEHFEMNFQLAKNAGTSTTDYLYRPSADAPGMQGGLWGIMRAFNNDKPAENLVPLPNNTPGDKDIAQQKCGCPDNAPVRKYRVYALSIDQYNNLLDKGGVLVYNDRYKNYDSRAIAFVQDKDVNDFKNKQGWQVEPLILRAVAGECIQVTLINNISETALPTALQFNYGTGNDYTIQSSFTIGLHPELLSYDVSLYDGTNVGLNADQQTIGLKDSITYKWYAGTWELQDDAFVPVPVEFGSTVLSAPDPLIQYIQGLFGAVIIEPKGTTWTIDQNTNASANVYDAEGNFLFRELVLFFQDNLNVPASGQGSQTPFPVNNALNYKSQPITSAYGTNSFNQVDVARATSNSLLDNYYPETPHFYAEKGSPMRFRLMHPGGQGLGEVWELHGHVWQEEPFRENSTVLGLNPASQWQGSRGELGVLNGFDILIASAGGANEIEGDYLYRSYLNISFQNGTWGILTVNDGNEQVMLTTAISQGDNKWNLSGLCTPSAKTGKMTATSVQLLVNNAAVATAPVGLYGSWAFENVSQDQLGDKFTIKASNGISSPVYLTKDLPEYEPVKISDTEQTADKPNVQLNLSPGEFGAKPVSKQVSKK